MEGLWTVGGGNETKSSHKDRRRHLYGAVKTSKIMRASDMTVIKHDLGGRRDLRKERRPETVTRSLKITFSLQQSPCTKRKIWHGRVQ